VSLRAFALCGVILGMLSGAVSHADDKPPAPTAIEHRSANDAIG